MKRWITFIMICIMACTMPIQAVAATTPVISVKKASPPDCYYHYDGQIWVYSTSGYKAEVKQAIKLLNKKFNVFRYTTAKSKRDVWVKDQAKPPKKTVIALTTQYTSSIVLYKSNMKKINKTMRVLTIAHELCHAAGLDHASARSSLMYPYIDRMNANGLSKADVKALKKARTRATTRNKQRKIAVNQFLFAEKNHMGIRFKIQKGQGNAMILAFSKRGTTYKSSNPKVLYIQPNGILTLKKAGNVTLTVNNAGKKHVFRIKVV